MPPRRDLALLVFVLLLGTYAYFWQGRDWNNASRLMLTYALVDRGTLRIDGLEINAGNPSEGVGDLARTPDGHYYSDKAPGQSLLGVPVYALVKWLGRFPDHPRNLPEARAFWPRDYWVTLGTSGMGTALLGVVLYLFFIRVGTSHAAAVGLAVAYGLGTPAFTYATLFYGHPTAALTATASFYLLYRASREPTRRRAAPMLLAGSLAGWAVVTELPMLLVAGILWTYGFRTLGWPVQSEACPGESLGRRPPRFQLAPVGWLTAGMVLSGLVLLSYQTLAFGHPLKTGYSYEIYEPFREAHTGIGIGAPDWSVAPRLLVSLDRGLFVYAPITLLAVPACFAMLRQRRLALVAVPLASFVALLLVNVCHRLPDGGLATGPRFLLPAVPMLMVPIAGWLAGAGATSRSRWHRRRLIVTALPAILGVIGVVSATAAGGRLQPSDPNPWKNQVIPAFQEGRLTRNLGSGFRDQRQTALEMAIPLACFWVVGGSLLVWRVRAASEIPPHRIPNRTQKNGGSHAKRDKPPQT